MIGPPRLKHAHTHTCKGQQIKILPLRSRDLMGINVFYIGLEGISDLQLLPVISGLTDWRRVKVAEVACEKREHKDGEQQSSKKKVQNEIEK